MPIKRTIICLLIGLILVVLYLTTCHHTCSFDQWVTVAEAGCTTEGRQERSCSCGQTESRVIPATGHRYKDGICLNCSSSVEASEGLDLIPNEDGSAYTVTGIGSFTGSQIVIPSTYNGLPVTAIGRAAFRDNENLVSLIIPGTITSIGNYAFANCAKLTDVVLENGVATIGESAFQECIALEQVELPESITSVGQKAFCNCTGLTLVYIRGASELGNGIFSGCTALTNAEFSEGITSIGSGLFVGCTRLSSVTLPSSLSTIGHLSFDGCISLEHIVYNGSKKAWQATEKLPYWIDESAKYTVHCANGNIENG